MNEQMEAEVEQVKIATNRVVADLRVLARNAEELLRATASNVSEKTVDIRARLEENLRDVNNRLAVTEALVVDKTKQAAEAADVYVRDNPWRAVGVAAFAGFLVGVLLLKRN
ncbi:MAG: YqjD family protein [Candidatus Methylacidiphilales bacterium]|nr:DUF883 family protein [Candidatus Methylacidiphilales bacterium]